MAISFKPLQEADLDLLCRWFDEPHVKEWWNDGLTHEKIKEKYRQRIGGTIVVPFVTYLDGKPIGFIQYYHANKVGDGWWQDEVDGTVGIDQFIGEADYINRGYGTQMICAFNKMLFKNSAIKKIITDVDPNNKRAIRCYEKSGFHFVKELMTPDGLANLMELTHTKTILSTERLILRTWQPSDIPLMAAISSDPLVMEYFPSTQDIAATQALIDRICNHYEKYGYSLYAVETKDTHEFIGFVGLSHPSFDIPKFKSKGLSIVEIGWRISSKHWGYGYATEAAKAVLHYAFIMLKLDEIISFTVPANTKSRRVMEKIGLHHSKEDDFEHPKIDNSSPLRQHVLYRLTRDDYIDAMSQP